VVVHTAAGSHRIPLLSVAAAGEVRDRIADLARTADDEP
jgi:membrane protein YdbS with pleckstrin-like domain